MSSKRDNPATISSGAASDPAVPFAAGASPDIDLPPPNESSSATSDEVQGPSPSPKPSKADPYMQMQLDEMEKTSPGSTQGVKRDEIMPGKMVQEIEAREANLKPPRTDPYMQTQLDEMEKRARGSSTSVRDEEILPKGMVEARRASLSTTSSGVVASPRPVSSLSHAVGHPSDVDTVQKAAAASEVGVGGFTGTVKATRTARETDPYARAALEVNRAPAESLPHRALDEVKHLATEAKDLAVGAVEGIKHAVFGAGAGGTEVVNKTASEAPFKPSSLASAASSRASNAASTAADKLSSVAGATRDAAGHAASATAGATQSAGETVTGTAGRAYEGAKGTATGAYEGAREVASSVGDKVTGAYEGAKQSVTGTLEHKAGGSEEYMRKAGPLSKRRAGSTRRSESTDSQAFEVAEAGGTMSDSVIPSAASSRTSTAHPTVEQEERDLERAMDVQRERNKDVPERELHAEGEGKVKSKL